MAAPAATARCSRSPTPPPATPPSPTTLVTFTGSDDGARPAGRPDRRRRRRPVRHDARWRRGQRRHGVRDRQHRHRLRHARPPRWSPFNGGNGGNPMGGLITDAAGDLFGTTSSGGADGDGTVFEIANTATGYATSPTTLVTFTGGDDGADPGRRPDHRHRRRPVRHDETAAGRTATARCSRSPTPPPATPPRPSRWSPSTAPATGRTPMPA